MYVNSNLPIHLPLPFLPYVHMYIVYVCISIPALEIGLSVPFYIWWLVFI